MTKVARLENWTWQDEFGHSTEVKLITEIVQLVPAGTIELDNGYEKYQARVEIDAPSGRVFVKPQTIDYYQSGAWLCRSNGLWYEGRLPNAYRYIMDGVPVHADKVKELLA